MPEEVDDDETDTHGFDEKVAQVWDSPNVCL